MGFDMESGDVTMTSDHYDQLMEAARLLQLARDKIIELEEKVKKLESEIEQLT